MARKSPKAGIALRREAREKYEESKSHEVGEGSRFKALEHVAEVGGAKNPGAVAATIGRKKYGKKKFQAMAAAGKK